MAFSAGRIGVALLLTAALAACMTPPSAMAPQVATVPPPPGAPAQVPPAQPMLPTPNPMYKVGEPYQIGGLWYYPKEQPDYDETGVASWYGTQFHGRLTANGEIFDRTAISAAHPTLPMPVNVRVTNLENGRIVVRVNDRGPFSRKGVSSICRNGPQTCSATSSGGRRACV
jgi:rare lipoprotein A